MSDDIKQRILSSGRMTEQELDAKIAEMKKKGARTALSAMKKIYREMATELKSEDDTVAGYFLGKYETRRFGTKAYLQLPEAATRGIVVVAETQKPSTDFGVGDPVQVTKLRRYQNIFTGYESFETSEKSDVLKAKMDFSLADCCPPLDAISRDGVYATRGSITQVWAKTDYSNRKEGQDIRELPKLPVLGAGGKVNLSVVVEKGQKSVSVSIPDVGRLERLLFSLCDAEEDKKGMVDFIKSLNSNPDSFRELRDMLSGVDVLMFGRHQSTFGRGSSARDVKPFFNISQMGWVERQRILPARETMETSGADVDEESEEEQ